MMGNHTRLFYLLLYSVTFSWSQLIETNDFQIRESEVERGLCWPSIQAALVQLVKTYQSLPSQYADLKTMVEMEASILEEPLGLNPITVSGIKRLACKVKRAGSLKAYMESLDVEGPPMMHLYSIVSALLGKRGDGPAAFLEELQGADRFFRYLQKHDLPREPPIEDIDVEELLMEVQTYVLSTHIDYWINHMDYINNMIVTYIGSESLEAAADAMDISVDEMADQVFLHARDTMPAVLSFLPPFITAVEELYQQGALDGLDYDFLNSWIGQK